MPPVHRLPIALVLVFGLASSAAAAPAITYRVVVQSGQPLPDGSTVSNSNSVSINAEGEAIVALDSTTIGGPSSVIWAELGGEGTPIARTGDMVGSDTVGDVLENRPVPRLRNGRAAFVDHVGTLWLWDGSLSVVARPTDVIGGQDVGMVQEFRLNPRGDLLFGGVGKAFFKADGGVAVFLTNGAGTDGGFALDDLGNVMLTNGTQTLLFGQPGSLVTVFQRDDPAPGGGQYFSIRGCALAEDTGIISFVSDDTMPGFEQHFYRGTPGSIVRVPTFPTGLPGLPALLSAGDVATALLPAPSLIDATGTISTILAVGDPAPGLAGETVATVGTRDVNAAGQVMLFGTTSADKSAIWQATPGKPIDLIAAPGLMIDIGPPHGVITVTNVSLNNFFHIGTHPQSADGDIIFEITYATATGSKMAVVVAGPSLLVNSHGDAPLLGGATSCETGATATSDDPECTLRAAIQLANTRPGKTARIRFALPTTAPIVTTSPLPEIEVSLDMAGDDGGLVEIAPATIAGSGSGLVVNGPTSRLRNIAIRTFSGDGITAASDSLTLEGCALTDNGGWGVHSNPGQLVIDAAGSRRSDIARNGTGGVLGVGTVIPVISVTSTDVHDNDGAGVVSNSQVDLYATAVTLNHGPGVAVLDGPGGTPAFAVTVNVGGDGTATEISDNQGEGIYTIRGGVIVNAPAAITGNGAWGVISAGTLSFGGGQTLSLSYRMTVANNGAGSSCLLIGPDVSAVAYTSTPCLGGGLLSTGSAQAANLIGYTDVLDNAGPGILSAPAITLYLVDVSRNAGPGVKRANVNGGGIDSDGGVMIDLPSTITNNAGYGIESLLGFVSIATASEIRGNTGAGIRTETSRVSLDTANAGATGRTVIAANGTGTCTVWDIDANDHGGPTTIPCELGGIVAPEDAVYAVAVDVTDNQGDGITAASVDLVDVSICGNTGTPLVVTGEQNLEAVDTCGDGGGNGDGDGGGDDAGADGGCRAAGGGQLGLAMLSIGFLLRRRRRRDR